MSIAMVDDVLITQLAAIADLQRPNEACGILLPICYVHTPQCPCIVELENKAPTRHADHSFEISANTILTRVWRWRRDHEDPDLPQTPYLPGPHGGYPTEIISSLAADIVVWHSHPSGQIGPSRGDLQQRIPGVRSLVITTFTAQRPAVTFY